MMKNDLQQRGGSSTSEGYPVEGYINTAHLVQSGGDDGVFDQKGKCAHIHTNTLATGDDQLCLVATMSHQDKETRLPSSTPRSPCMGTNSAQHVRCLWRCAELNSEALEDKYCR